MADADAGRVTDDAPFDSDDAPHVARGAAAHAEDPNGEARPGRAEDASDAPRADTGAEGSGDTASDEARDDVNDSHATTRGRAAVDDALAEDANVANDAVIEDGAATAAVVADDDTEDAGGGDDDARPVATTAASDDPGHRARRRGKHEPGRARRFVGSTWFLILVALAVALVVKTFLIQAFYIPSRSMVPTLAVGDRVFVNKLAYGFGDVHRGDVIVFSDPNGDDGDRNVVGGFLHWLGEGFGLSQPSDEDYIKRVVGLPGETIEIVDDVVYIDGEPLEEPYLTPAARRSNGDYALAQIPDDAVFVMGDNRGGSGDSRTVLGFVPLDRIIGRAFVIIWPPSDIGGIDDGS